MNAKLVETYLSQIENESLDVRARFNALRRFNEYYHLSDMGWDDLTAVYIRLSAIEDAGNGLFEIELQAHVEKYGWWLDNHYRAQSNLPRRTMADYLKSLEAIAA